MTFIASRLKILPSLGLGLLFLMSALPSRALTLKPLWERDGSDVRGVAFSPDGTSMAVFGNLRIEVSDLRTGEQTASFQGADKDVISFAYTPDGQSLVGYLYDNLEYRGATWRVSDGARTAWFGMGSIQNSGVYITSDMKYAVRSDQGKFRAIRIYRVSDGTELWEMDNPSPCCNEYSANYPANVIYRPEIGAMLVVTRVSTIIRRAETGEVLAQFTPEEWETEKVKYPPLPAEPLNPNITGYVVHRSADRRIVVTASFTQPYYGDFQTNAHYVLHFVRESYPLRFWNAETGELLDTVEPDPGYRNIPWFSPDSKYLVYNRLPLQDNASEPGDLVAALNPYGNPGDVGLDGRVDVTDAVRTLRFLVDLDTPTADERFRADVNGDDSLTISDVVLTLGMTLNVAG